MNHFYCNLDNLLNKFEVNSSLYTSWYLQPITFPQVYNVHTMKDEFMIVSGMPERNGLHLITKIFFWSRYISLFSKVKGMSLRLPPWRLIFWLGLSSSRFLTAQMSSWTLGWVSTGEYRRLGEKITPISVAPPWAWWRAARSPAIASCLTPVVIRLAASTF